MHKDVECTFGIAKGCFRILKPVSRLHGVDVADKIWLTCCALHGSLLDKDGKIELLVFMVLLAQWMRIT